MPGVLARKGHLSHAVPGKRSPCPGVFAARLFMRPQQLAWQFLLILRRVKKSHSRPIEYVGATIGRPPTWRSNAFLGKSFSQANGHGRAMLAPTSPLKLKLHLFRQVCRGRIYASRAVYPLYRIIGTAAAGGIYAAPTYAIRQECNFLTVCKM